MQQQKEVSGGGLRPLSLDDILYQRARLRELTLENSPYSDMNELLNEAQQGISHLTCAAAWEIEGNTIGWAVVQKFRGKDLVSVFVAKDFRRQGIGSALVREVLRDRSRESLRFDGKKVPAFWAHLGLGDHGLGKD